MDSRFHFKDFLKSFTLSILIYTGFAALFAAVPNVSETIEGFPSVASFLIEYALQFVVLFFPLWIFVVSKYGADLSDFAFKSVPLKTVVKTVLGAYLAYLLISTGIFLILTLLNLKLPGYEPQSSYLPLFGDNTLGILIGFLFTTLIAPFLEELLFRGFVYRVFVQTWVPWVGSLFTAILFALAHMQLQTFFPLLILGLLLNTAYRRTGSVWTSVALHSFNNLIAFGIDVYLSKHPELLEQMTAFIYSVKI